MIGTVWTLPLNGLLVVTAFAQLQDRSISIDRNRPYIDIVLARTGERTPIFDGEITDGMWLRLRNNCILPIKVNVLRRKSKDSDGFLVVHQVVEYGRVRNAPQVRESLTELKPTGYENPGLIRSEIVSPGSSIVFSVPINHVSRYWYLQVEVDIQIPHAASGRQPRLFVEFEWSGLDKRTQAMIDELLAKSERQ
jgi:hypothetical protein